MGRSRNKEYEKRKEGMVILIICGVGGKTEEKSNVEKPRQVQRNVTEKVWG